MGVGKLMDIDSLPISSAGDSDDKIENSGIERS